jgi:uncharacterized protein YjbJ (UPF0337 family)
MKGKIKEVVWKIVKNRELEAEGKAENVGRSFSVDIG